MPDTWYRVSRWRDKIEAVEVERETEKSIWIVGDKSYHGRPLATRKISGGDEFYKSRDEAIRAKTQIIRNNLDRAETDIIHAQRKKEKAESALERLDRGDTDFLFEVHRE